MDYTHTCVLCMHAPPPPVRYRLGLACQYTCRRRGSGVCLGVGSKRDCRVIKSSPNTIVLTTSCRARLHVFAHLDSESSMGWPAERVVRVQCHQAAHRGRRLPPWLCSQAGGLTIALCLRLCITYSKRTLNGLARLFPREL